jgi:anaerobic ribonucleoside-triphosphate reductase activating protein
VDILNYADYKKYDFLNGTGLRNSLFVSGCNHACNGCFNAVSWNFNFGKPFTKEMEDMIINDLNVENINIRGLSLLGGEPFEHPERLTQLLERVREECSGKDVWSWSGYTFEQIIADEKKREMLGYIDILVDGKFEIDKRSLKLKFRGSSNQRIIDVKKSLKEGLVVLSII